MANIMRVVLLFALLMASIDCARNRIRQQKRKIGAEKLEEVFAWKQMEYETGFEGQSGTIFDVPMGFEVWKDKLILGFPRRRPQIPATLNYVSLSGGSKSPVLKPYPNADINNLNSPNAIASVSRPKSDSCNRLWVFDTGVVIVNGTSTQAKVPEIVIFDLDTDEIIRRYAFRNTRDFINNDASGMVSTTVDITNGDCENAFAYIPDLINFGITVYSFKDNDSWRVKHNFFYLDPEEGDFNVNGLKFQWDDGVFSVALGPVEQDGFRTVYFHAMASYQERAVSSRVLRNKTLATRTYHGDDFWTVGTRGKMTQTNIHAVDLKSGVMLSIQPATNSLNCWNTKTHLNENNLGVIAQDNDLLHYPSDMKISNDDYVWVLSNKFTYFLYSTFNITQNNFRIFRVPVNKAIEGTVCAKRRGRN